MQKRIDRNKQLLERMNNPEDDLTNGTTQEDMFFPMRKIIKKDEKIISKLFRGGK